VFRVRTILVAVLLAAAAALPAQAIDFAAGELRGEVIWNGARITGPSLWTNYVDLPGISNRPLDNDGTYRFAAVQPGSYQMGFYPGACGPHEPNKVAEFPVQVRAGETVVYNPDITAAAGRVVGHVTVNGTSLPNGYFEMENACHGWYGDSDGSFVNYMKPGSYTVRVHGPSGILGSFTFPIVAGETTDVGTLTFGTGELRGEVIWNGARITGPSLWTNYVDLPGISNRPLDNDGTYRFAAVQPGSYQMGFYPGACGPHEPNKVAEFPVQVRAGETVVYNPDITAAAGRVVGHVTVNGTSLPNGYFEMENACHGWYGDSDGSFVNYMKPGSYTVRVHGPSGILGSFTFPIVAGETTDVDFGTTPPGDNVNVELEGGLDEPGGVSIVFDTVTTGGSTVVVESGVGPAPPTGYSIVGLNGGPRYWDLETTAVYQGSITVCFRYDVSQLEGNEERLQLRHYGAGNEWEDITVEPIDTVNDIICGVTQSLSPFAIFEPLNAPPAANADTYSTAEDTTLTVTAPGVLQNDSDDDGDALQVSLVDGPQHGSVVLNADGSFQYTPNLDFASADSFRYRASDGTEDSPATTVVLNVTPVDDPPVARDDIVSLDEDGAVTVPVLGNDTDVDNPSMTVTGASQPGHGSVVVNADGTISYVPAPNFHGTDSFQYQVSSGGKTAVATVQLTVRPVNDAPVCAAVTADTSVLWPADQSLRQVALRGATDVDGDAVLLRVTAVTQDESVNGLGDGDKSPDAVAGPEPNQVALRAERSGMGDGRVYSVTYVVSDGRGGECSGVVKVGVPVHQGKGSLAIESAQSFNSFGT
jgi:hypothetical protein